VGDIAKDHGRHQEQPIVGPALLRCDGCGHIQRHCCFQQHSCRNIMHLGTTATHPLLKSVQALCFRDGQDRRARWVEHLRRCWPDSVSTFDQEEGVQACRVNQMSAYPFSLTPSKQCYFAEYVQKRGRPERRPESREETPKRRYSNLLLHCTNKLRASFVQ
jgi:hypothetical protein